MKELILLTLASSGIGYELAKLLGREKFDLIIVARRLDLFKKLKNELNKQYGITVHTMGIETEFNTPRMLNTNAYKANKPVPVSYIVAVDVRHLLYGNRSKKVAFNTWFISNLPRTLPDKLMMKIKKNLTDQQK